MSKSFANAGHVRFGNVITGNAWQVVVLPKEALLDKVFEAALLHGVLGEFAHVDSAELVDLRCN